MMKPCVYLLENVFHLCMHEGNRLAEIVLHEQTQVVANVACRVQIVANAACRVGSQLAG